MLPAGSQAGSDLEAQIHPIGDDSINAEVEKLAHPHGIVDGPDVHLDTRVMQALDHPLRGHAQAERPLGHLNRHETSQCGVNGGGEAYLAGEKRDRESASGCRAHYSGKPPNRCGTPALVERRHEHTVRCPLVEYRFHGGLNRGSGLDIDVESRFRKAVKGVRERTEPLALAQLNATQLGHAELPHSHVPLRYALEVRIVRNDAHPIVTRVNVGLDVLCPCRNRPREGKQRVLRCLKREPTVSEYSR